MKSITTDYLTETRIEEAAGIKEILEEIKKSYEPEFKLFADNERPENQRIIIMTSNILSAFKDYAGSLNFLSFHEQHYEFYLEHKDILKDITPIQKRIYNDKEAKQERAIINHYYGILGNKLAKLYKMPRTPEVVKILIKSLMDIARELGLKEDARIQSLQNKI